MAMLSSSLALDVVALVVGLLGILFLYFTRNFKYWKKRGIPYVTPIPFAGNFKKVVLAQEGLGECLGNLYLQTKGEPFVGIFAFDRPLLLIRDSDLIKTILVQDFSYFTDHIFTPDEDLDPLPAKCLVGITGSKWRHTRAKLTPTFTSGKMKILFHLVNECGKNLAQCIEDSAKDSGEVEIKDVMARYTTDTIATCAFGIESNSLKNPDEEFRRISRLIFDFSLWKSIKLTIAFLAPAILSTLRLRIFQTEITEFLRKTIWETVEYREKNNVVRKDFLDLLMQIKNKGRVDEDDGHNNGFLPPASKLDPLNVPSLQGDDFVAQAFVFLAAGYETSSSTMTFALYELCLQPDIQKRVREDIQSALETHSGQVTYEAIKEMEYLHMVVTETLRMYPIVPFLDRQVLQNYKIPGSDFVLEKGSGLMIPVLGIQRDEQHFPNPNHFDPERFTEENMKQQQPYTYIPFGEGPRMCLVEVCQTRMKSLKDRYTREKKGMADRTKSGSQANYKEPWPLMHILRFLDEHIKKRRTFSNLASPEPETTTIGSNSPIASIEEYSNEFDNFDIVFERELGIVNVEKPTPLIEGQDVPILTGRKSSPIPLSAKEKVKAKRAATTSEETSSVEKNLQLIAEGSNRFSQTFERKRTSEDAAFAEFVTTQLSSCSKI